MQQFVFNEESIRELNRMMYTLYKFFSITLSECDKKPTAKWDTRHDIDIHLCPWNYFKFTNGANSICIHHHRDDTYSLECFGYVPRTLKPQKISYRINLQRKIFI